MRFKAPPASQYLGYAPRNTPPLHLGAHEPSYAVPYTSNGTPGNGSWSEVRQNLPPAPVMAILLFITKI